MKAPLLSGYVFTPSLRRLDFSNVAGFDVRRLTAVINLSAGNETIYAIGDPTLGYTAILGPTLTLAADTTAMAESDTLLVLYEDGILGASEAKLEAVRALLAGTLDVEMPADGVFAANFGVKADEAATSDSGAFSLLAFIKRGLANWTTLLSRLPALVSGRVPVTAALDGGAATVFLAAGTEVVGALHASGNGANGTTYATFQTAGTAAAGQIIKGSAGNVFTFTAWNTDTAGVFAKLFNKAGVPVLGIDPAVWEVYVPPNSTVSVPFHDVGMSFGAGIAVGFSGAPGAGDATPLNAAGKAGIALSVK